MSVYDALQAQPRQRDVEPPLPDRPWVVNDQNLDAHEIAADEWPDYQARGYRLAPHGSSAIRYGEPMQAPDPASRELWPVAIVQQMGGGQDHQWSTKRHLARKATAAAVEKLAARIGRPFIPLNAEGSHRDAPLSPAVNIDLAHAAMTAESVVALADDVDKLKAAVAALQAAQENTHEPS